MILSIYYIFFGQTELFPFNFNPCCIGSMVKNLSLFFTLCLNPWCIEFNLKKPYLLVKLFFYVSILVVLDL